MLREGKDEPKTTPPPADNLLRRGRRQQHAGRTPSRAWPSTATAARGPASSCWPCSRAGHHLVHIESEEDLLHSILNDAVSTLDAQRGAIVLADGARRPAAAARPGQRPQPDSQPARLQPEPGPALVQPRRVDPVLQRRRRPRAGRRPQHRRGHHGLGAVRAAAHAAQDARRAAPGPRPAAEAVHQGRPAPGRRPGRQRLRRHRERPAAPQAARAVPTTRSPSWPRPSSCATSTPAATPTASPTYSLPARPAARPARRGPGADPHRHAAARHRQDRHRRRHPAQARQADAGGVRDHEDAHDQGRRDPRAGRRPAAGHPDRPLAPRALGRQGLPGRPGRRGRSRGWPASSPSPTPSTP